MSISRTSLASPSYLMRIKAAILRAVVKANKPGAVNGLGFGDVYNRHGKASLEIVARRGAGFEVFDNDRDITELVKAALCAHHAAKGALS